MLEGMVGKLRRMVRRRVTVARSPVEGDCAVSCGRGGEKHSVNRETGTVDLNQNPRGGALGAPSGLSCGLHCPTRLRGFRREAEPRTRGVTWQPAHRPVPCTTLTSPPFPNLCVPLPFTESAASAPNLPQGSMKTAQQRKLFSPKTKHRSSSAGAARASEMDLLS